MVLSLVNRCLGRRTRFDIFAVLISLNLLIPLFLEVSLVQSSVQKPSTAPVSTEDSDFAEFEDEDEVPVPKTGLPSIQEERRVENEAQPPASKKPSHEEIDEHEALVEDEPVEEEDEEEVTEDSRGKDKRSQAGQQQQPQLRITNIPAHLLNNWDSYYAEILFALLIIIYFINFIVGRSKNELLANAWLEVNRPLLEANFALVGDDGKKEIENKGFLKDMENVFYIWSSGRVGVEGMLIELRLWRRHDLFSVLQKLLKPVNDQIIIKFNLNADSIDNFVLCLATKKSAVRLVKEYPDLSTFCPERKTVEKYGLNSDKFVIMSEIGEVAANIFDKTVVSIFNRFEDLFDYIHVSDQFSGPKGSDYDPLPIKLPEVKKVAIFALNLSPPKGVTTIEGIEEAKPVLQLVLYLIDKMRKYRLSKEGKAKSDKDRQKVEETFLKATHAQRQEAAQLKREERKRAEKERILNEDDPEKQRKWEEREYRREMKKKVPKMKQVKVKAM